MERRTGIYWYHYQKRAASLEPSLGYTQYSTLPFGKLITAANAIRVLYIVAFLMWLGAFAINLPEGQYPGSSSRPNGTHHDSSDIMGQMISPNFEPRSARKPLNVRQRGTDSGLSH
jgi:hypothetical protein